MKTRKLSLRQKEVLTMLILGVIVSMLLGFVTKGLVEGYLVDVSRQSAKELAKIAASEIDGAVFEGIESIDDGYMAVYNSLSKYRDQSSTVKYIYTMRYVNENTLEFVVDTDISDPASIGERYDMLPDILKAFKTGSATVDAEVSKDEWGSFYSAYAPILNNGVVVGIVGCDVSLDMINLSLSDFIGRLGILATACCGLCIVAGLVTGTGFKVASNKLISQLNDIVNTDGDLTKRVDVKLGDEFELIADGLNNLMDKFQGLVSNVTWAANVVKESSMVLDNGTVRGLNSITGISESMCNLSASMEETTSSSETIESIVHDLTESVSSMNTAVSEVSVRVDAIETSAKATLLEADKNREKLEKDVEELNTALETAAEGSRVVARVFELSSKISDISDKINLLSLNASIEAARAGVHGRSFSVIASNITGLASGTKDAAKEINDMVSGVVDAVNALIDCSLKAKAYISTTVTDSCESLTEICKRSSADAGVISNAISSISKFSDDITERIGVTASSISEISHSVQDNTEDIVGVNSRTEDLKALLDGAKREAARSLKSAEDLIEVLSFYKYE